MLLLMFSVEEMLLNKLTKTKMEDSNSYQYKLNSIFFLHNTF
jgi:hypothetical protein